MCSDVNNYEIIQKYFYKGFQITICFFSKKDGKREPTAFIRNKKWTTIDFILITGKDEKNLREKVSLFLQNPDLREEKTRDLEIIIFRTPEQRLKLQKLKELESDKTLFWHYADLGLNRPEADYQDTDMLKIWLSENKMLIENLVAQKWNEEEC